MTEYPQYPAGETPEPAPQRGPTAPRPRSIQMAVNLIWVAVALTVLSTVLALANIDEAVDLALESDTTGTLTEEAARSATILVTVLFLVIGVALYAMLAIFIGKGRNWARIVYTVLAALFLALGVLGLTGDQPAFQLMMSLVQVLVTAATLFFLWQKESSAWFKGQPVG